MLTFKLFNFNKEHAAIKNAITPPTILNLILDGIMLIRIIIGIIRSEMFISQIIVFLIIAAIFIFLSIIRYFGLGDAHVLVICSCVITTISNKEELMLYICILVFVSSLLFLIVNIKSIFTKKRKPMVPEIYAAFITTIVIACIYHVD